MQLFANDSINRLFIAMGGITALHVALAALLLFFIACVIGYRMGYHAAEHELRDKIHSHEKECIKIEAQIFQRERSLKEKAEQLQSDIKQFEVLRLQRIDERVQELFDEKRKELQAEFERKQEELRGKYQKIETQVFQRERSLKERADKLQSDIKQFEVLRLRRIDDRVHELFDEKHKELQSEFVKKEEELRGKYKTERSKLRRDYKIAEEQFKEEYEKWKTRNRDDEERPEFSEKLSPDQMAAFGYIKQMRRNFFVQGQAGTGKSTLIRYLKEHLKRPLLLASPTGAAAKLIGGSTLHSLFKLPRNNFINVGKHLKPRVQTEELLRKAETLIIDEVSMVRPDILDSVDYIARQSRKDNSPFGGLQIVLVGDLFQLPPVITHNAEPAFAAKYGYANAYFFDAPSFRRGNFIPLMLMEIHRQNDPELLENLGNIIRGENLEKTLNYFNSSKIRDDKTRRESTTITPTNKAAASINNKRLGELETPEREYIGDVIEGVYDPNQAPAEHRLILKVGALVIFTTNSQKIINGTKAVVVALSNTIITVRLTESGQDIGVTRDMWIDYEYIINKFTHEVEEVEKGRYSQFPLRLGYAMTIHKAQGMTLDNVIIDKMYDNFFAHGQLYVALTRTRAKANIHIEKDLKIKDICFDSRILAVLRPIANGIKDVDAWTVSEEQYPLAIKTAN